MYPNRYFPLIHGNRPQNHCKIFWQIGWATNNGYCGHEDHHRRSQREIRWPTPPAPTSTPCPLSQVHGAELSFPQPCSDLLTKRNFLKMTRYAQWTRYAFLKVISSVPGCQVLFKISKTFIEARLKTAFAIWQAGPLAENQRSSIYRIHQLWRRAAVDTIHNARKMDFSKLPPLQANVYAALHECSP